MSGATSVCRFWTATAWWAGFDPKLERANGLLRLKKLYLEPGVKPSARLTAAVARALRDFMRFHGANDLAVEHSEPSNFGAKLTKAL